MKFQTDSTYANEKTVWKLNPSDDDRIKMMLNPHQGSRLPTLRLLSTEDQVLTTIAHANSPMVVYSSSAGGRRGAQQAPLPAIAAKSSTLKDAYFASLSVKQKTEGVKTMFEARPDLNRSTPWSIVDIAMENAKQNVKVTGKRGRKGG